MLLGWTRTSHIGTGRRQRPAPLAPTAVAGKAYGIIVGALEVPRADHIARGTSKR
jgi:hypothetical protein